jgi:hypothetical protein
VAMVPKDGRRFRPGRVPGSGGVTAVNLPLGRAKTLPANEIDCPLMAPLLGC